MVGVMRLMGQVVRLARSTAVQPCEMSFRLSTAMSRSHGDLNRCSRHAVLGIQLLSASGFLMG